MYDANPDTPDGAIIADVLSGDTQQFAVIVRRYEHALIRFAKSRLGHDDWAEDVTQETFLCAFKWLRSYDSRFSFRTWLWTILLNQCRRLHRKNAKKPRVELWSDRPKNDVALVRDLPLVGENEESPPMRLLAKERAEKLQSLLQALPEAQGDALRLRFYGGLKFQEIADAMQCSLSTAKNRVRWGLMNLSEQLVSGEMR